MMYTLTKWILSLPDRLLLWMSGQPQITASGGRAMDPASQFLLLTSLKQQLLFIDESKTVPELREWWKGQLAPFDKPPLGGVSHRDMDVAVGDATIRVREYTPDGVGGAAPALVYLHGGGFTTFEIETYQGFCEFVAAQLGAKIYSVEYRLAPEHPYPIPLDDCRAAFEWVCSRAADFGLDPERIAVGGDSAGGNLSAALCLKQRDTGGPMPTAQLLIYPTTDLDSDFPSMEEFAEGQIITRRHIEWFHSNYVPDKARMKEPYASPLLAESHANLPPAVVCSAGFDPLRDEAEAYAKALTNAGVPTEYIEFDALGHGFIVTDAARAAREANTRICAVFRSVM